MFRVSVIVGLINIVFSLVDQNLVVEYYKMKGVNSLIVFSCINTSESVKLVNYLFENNIYVSINDINTINKADIKKFILKHGQQGFVLDFDCGNYSFILKECTREELFFDKYKWLIFSTSKTILQTIQNIDININAEITIVIHSNLEPFWHLLDIYNPGYRNGGTLKINSIGIWSPNSGLILNKSMTAPKYVRRRVMTGVNFTGMIVLVNKYPGDLLEYLYNNDENKILDNFARYYFLLFDHVKDVHNFTLIVKLNHVYGNMAPNGSFNGLVGALQRKEVDFGLAPIYYKADRVPFVDNLVPTYLMKTRFIFRHPKPALTIRGSFFSPLSSIVWLCVFGIMILTSIIIYITFTYEWNLERQKNDKENYTEHDWSYVVLTVFGGVCQQDVSRIPNLYSSRTIVFISVFFTYMLYQFYSGGIVSSLLSEPPRTIRNLEDLLHSQMKIGVEEIIYEHDYFEQTNDPVAIELYKKKIAGRKNGSDAFYDVKTGMQLVKKGDHAFQTDTSTGYAVIAEEYSNEIICGLGEVQLYPNQYTAGVVPQDSPFREFLVYSFQRMVESGIVYRQRIRWTTAKPACIKIVDSGTIFVTISEFFPAILFYMVGIILSLLIFGFEIWIGSNKNGIKNKCARLYM